MMAIESKSVYSSHVDTVSYDDEKQELSVRWDTGKTSIYSGVPPYVANEVMNSWSVGKALHSLIKNNDAYPHRYGPEAQK